MATKQTDSSKYKGLRGFLRQNLGKDKDGRGIVRHTVSGIFNGFSLGAKNEGKRIVATQLTLMGTFVASGTFIDSALERRIDWTPEHVSYADHTPQNNQALGYEITTRADDERETHRYYLLSSDTGPVLMKANDDNPHDDLLVPVTDSFEAARVAGEITARLNTLQAGYDAAYEDIDPFIVSYEGMSAVFQNSAADYGNTTYIIGDNIDHDIAISPTDIAAEQVRWQQAALDFMAGGGGEVIAVLEGEHLADNYSGFNIWLSVMGGIAGLGAATGMAQGVAASRRRYAEELKAKP